MKLHELREALAARTREMRSLLDAANGAELADEARKRFDALENECRSLNQRIAAETRVAELERTAAATPLGDQPADLANEIRAYSIVRAIAGAAGVPGIDDAREREVSAELAKRSGVKPQGVYVPLALLGAEKRVVVTGSSGAGAVGTDTRYDLTVESLRARSVAGRAGAVFLTGLSHNVSIPAIDVGATTSWIATEGGGTVSAVDFDINARTLAPKTVMTMTELSRGMLVNSDAVEGLVRNDMSRALAAALDSAALAGGGSNEPVGILAALVAGPGLGTFATPTHAQGLALMTGPETDVSDGERWAWALHPRAAKKLQSTLVAASTDSRHIMEGNDSLFGRPAFQTAHAALFTGSPLTGEAAAIYGAFENLLVGVFGEGVDLLTNPYTANSFARGGVAVRGMLSCDIAIRHIEAFSAAIDMATP